MTSLPPSVLAGYWRQLRKPLELEVARGCPDTAIAGASIGVYARLWAQRLQAGSEDDARMAQSLARGLRDYAGMAVAERRRRAVAAIDLLRRREEASLPPSAARRKAEPVLKMASSRSRVRATPPRETPPDDLPVGHELLEMPLSLLAPRARWPHLLAQRLGLESVRDLLYHIPRDWIDIRPIAALADGERAGLVGTVTRRQSDRLKSVKSSLPLTKYTLTVTDDSGEAWVTSITTRSEHARGKGAGWSPAQLSFRPGQRIFALGKVDRVGKIIDLRMEDIFEITAREEHDLLPGARVPLYALTAGVYQNQVHRAVLRVLATLGTGESANAMIDPLPVEIRTQYDLLPLVEALQELHRASSPRRHEQGRTRLAFEEFLTPQLVLAQRRHQLHHQNDAPVFAIDTSLPDLVQTLVPFPPTRAQLHVLADIEEDLRSPHPMNRLLQGDVGSGKTLVAAGALLFAARAGLQAAIMAPTEILAEQLYLVLSHLLAPSGHKPVLLTGSVPPAERRAALAAMAAGTAAIAVGTQALIQDGVAFRRLGLTIIDEQHRFGVQQRAILRGKGETPNALIMTATPIPRTLSLTAYGDLDVSVLDEMPPGRSPVQTRWMATDDLPQAYRFIREEVDRGRQAYVLCPLVEQSDLLQADAATEMAEELRRQFPDLQVGLLHGRLQPDEKDAAMEDFRLNRTRILACTTVIEVGVDVPNATVMLIHSAERFGLAQLHQLRGRVGRSQHQSHCLLISQPRFNPDIHDGEDTPARQRLRIMVTKQDGFAIAEADLAIRGPGEYFGTRQSGLVDFTIGNLLHDGLYLQQAREAAHAIIADDPALAAPHHAELRRRVQHLKTTLDQFRA